MKPIRYIILGAAVFTSAVSGSAFAQESAVQKETGKTGALAVHAGFGIATGGEELFKVTSGSTRPETLKAGTGITWSIGATYDLLRMNEHSIGAGADIGYKSWSIGGEPLDVGFRLRRLPLMARVQYEYKSSPDTGAVVGAGLQYELGVSLNGEDTLSDLKLDFDNALGYFIEVGATIDHWRVGFDVMGRFTFLDYSYSDNGINVNGNSFGLVLRLHYSPL